MDTNELQCKGEKFSISWDPGDKIFFLKMWGDHSEKDAKDFNKKMYGFIDKIPGSEPIDILVDTSKQGKTGHEARRIYANTVTQYPRPTNVAICGASVLIKMITNFIVNITGKVKGKNIKMFATTEEGLKWLRGMKAEG